MNKILKISGIILLIIMVCLIAVGLYFTRFSADYRVFKVGGGGIGEYQSGTMVKTTADFSHPLNVGDVVVYQQGNATVMAIVKELRDEEYVVERSRKREETIGRGEIKWLVAGELY